MEFSHRSGRDLVNMAKKRTNVIPIIEDARHPAKYRMLVGMVDVIFSDVAQPDQVCFLIFFLCISELCDNFAIVWLMVPCVFSYNYANDEFTRIPLQDILKDESSSFLMYIS